ncbi:MAG: hypothetical protein EHM16_16380 [Betaproteobacteria bacterium]|nr:MAG: hypothetical protein EHM16_16380 [Betaproteobacteria bacterium]
MKQSDKKRFGFARLIVIAAVLLCAPFAAAATDSPAHAVPCAEHEIGCDDRISVFPDTQERHGSDQPLHCHLKSPHPQQIGLTPIAVETELPLLISDNIPSFASETGTYLPAVWAGIPIPAPPRFILFGNFRS